MTPVQKSGACYKACKPKDSMDDVSLSNYLYDLDDNIKVHDFHRVIQEHHKKSGKTIRSIAKIIGVHEVTCRCYLNGNSRPSFRVLKKLSKVCGVDFLQVAFDEDYLFVIKSKVVRLPRKLTSELAYYIGYLQGDGYLESDKKSLGFTDEYLSQIENISNLTMSLFGISGVVVKQQSRIAKKDCYVLLINSYIVNSFIHNVFGVIRGVKTELRIPKIMFSNKEILKIYVSGLYDADGTLPINPERVKQFFLDITMKDKVFMQEIKTILKSFGIETLKLYERIAHFPTGKGISITWEIRIRKSSEMLKFLDVIGFKHPDKSRRQKELILILQKRARRELNSQSSP